MSETIERLRAEVERAGGGARGYLLAAEKAVVERDALQRNLAGAWKEVYALREKARIQEGMCDRREEEMSALRSEVGRLKRARLRSADWMTLEKMEEMMDPRRGEVCVICGHEAVSILRRWQHYMVAGRERAICATCVEGALFAALRE